MPGTLPPEGPKGPPPGDPVSEEGITVPKIGDLPEDSVGISPSVLVDDVATVHSPRPEPEKQEDPEALIGTVISGRYRVEELIGKGGMGAVYRGEQTHLRKQVAIKVLRARVQKLPEIVARFEREAVAGAHVKHPNVVSATDFGQLDDGSYFLILEFVEGTSLKDLIAQGPIPVARALAIARQIASALAAVHEKGIVHRDVKPLNVLIDKTDQVKLIDFGLARVRVDDLAKKRGPASQKSPPLTAAGVIFGTFSYLAPEAALGMEAVDERADLYALGIVLYEMLCQKHPFDAKDRMVLFKLQQLEDPPPLRVRAPEANVRPEVEAVVMRLIQRERAARYPSALAAIEAIDEAIASLDRPLPPPDVDDAPRPKPKAGKLPPWMIVAAAAAAVVIGGGVVFGLKKLYPKPKGPDPIASITVPVMLPSGSASSAPPIPSGDAAAVDPDVLRGHLKKAVSVKDWGSGEKVIMALAKIDPKLVGSDAVRSDVVAVAAGVGFDEGSEAADELFELLTHGLGNDGLDILFELARGRGGTKGGRRALEILSRPDVVVRESPALRVTLEFLKGSCDARRGLLDRAAAEGDQRTLAELTLARSAKCANKKDPCCFREDKGMADAIKKLKDRLGG